MKSILLLLTISFSLSAQVKGVVKDSISGKPIEYVGVFTSKTENNFSTDKNGKFKEKELQKTDTLWFFTSGYEIKKILVKDVKKQVLLKPLKQTKQKKHPLLINLNSKSWLDLTSKQKNKKSLLSCATNLRAYYLHGIKSDSCSVFIETLQLGFINNKDNETVYKIRFFESDSLQQIGKEINNPIIQTIKPPKTGKLEHYKDSIFQIKKTYIIKPIDLLTHQICVPNNGLFIAIELLNIKQNVWDLYYNKHDNTIKVIMPIVFLSNTSTKTYDFEKGKWVINEKSNHLPNLKITIAQKKD